MKKESREVGWGVGGVETEEAAEMQEGPAEEETNEERKPRRMADPAKPTKREIEEHEIAHLPYRSWRWACVQGRGKAAPRRRGREPGDIPGLHMDFAFLG